MCGHNDDLCTFFPHFFQSAFLSAQGPLPEEEEEEKCAGHLWFPEKPQPNAVQSGPRVWGGDVWRGMSHRGYSSHRVCVPLTHCSWCTLIILKKSNGLEHTHSHMTLWCSRYQCNLSQRSHSLYFNILFYIYNLSWFLTLFPANLNILLLFVDTIHSWWFSKAQTGWY